MKLKQWLKEKEDLERCGMCGVIMDKEGNALYGKEQELSDFQINHLPLGYCRHCQAEEEDRQHWERVEREYEDTIYNKEDYQQ